MNTSSTVSLLGPRGTPMVELGGDRAWLVRTKGDIVCSYQWLDIGEEEPSACMVLFPAARRLDVQPYVIPQENAWRFADRNGHATPHAIKAGFVAACDMGFPDRSTVHRIVDVILDGLGDLVRMPSSQPHDLHVERAVLGIEARGTINGHVVAEEVL